jgi:hypothetical protein
LLPPTRARSSVPASAAQPTPIAAPAIARCDDYLPFPFGRGPEQMSPLSPFGRGAGGEGLAELPPVFLRERARVESGCLLSNRPVHGSCRRRRYSVGAFQTGLCGPTGEHNHTASHLSAAFTRLLPGGFAFFGMWNAIRSEPACYCVSNSGDSRVCGISPGRSYSGFINRPRKRIAPVRVSRMRKMKG